ncbi:ATP phosphoribosyltransferase regulatory subunit [Siminovitchia terrae]|uniref:ATP phosphoribosyltransferase regulatory subunit n=1 Tax=Siminovitchia terrae TaxID=1914933 RepID=UPI001B05BC23|nr:ATP phosphoribosyltransferase regulatory subunit [Siminovitchia terrae]GIN92120.1 ATP phosphoribosyltransferase regulatory subunit [Siminovitchia terrae]
MFLPAGSRDEMGPAVSNRFSVMEKFREVAVLRGYEQISTPVFEYASTFTNEYVGMNLQNMLKWFNSEGEIEVLRPDWTTSIARALSSQDRNPQKWAYQGSVFKTDRPGMEDHQAGIEILHMPTLMGEIESLLMASSILKSIGITDYVIELGHTELYESLVQELDLKNEEAERLRQAMHDKKQDEVYEIALHYGDEQTAKELAALVDAYGGIEVITEYEERWKDRKDLLDMLAQMKKVAQILTESGSGEILVDLGRVKNLPYYSGMLYRGFLKKTGVVCFSGGRYDKLYDRYGGQVSAAGLAFDVDVLAEIYQEESSLEKVCIIANIDALVYAEKLRQSYENCIVDVRTEKADSDDYDKIVEIKLIDGKYEVLEK